MRSNVRILDRLKHVRFRRWQVVTGSALALLFTLVGVSVAGVFPGAGAGAQASGQRGQRAPEGGSGRAVASSPAASSPAPGPGASGSGRHARTTAHGHPRAGRTSCRSVAHIGDSTSVGMVSADFLPSASQRLEARYKDVGVRHTLVDASGGRSIVERMPGQANGNDVATAWDRQGYHGCWVIALGTNDTANVAVGSDVGRMGRVERMLAAAHGQPVMWVDLKTLNSSGPWSEADMQLWNDTLRRACGKYPNLRVFDWASAANDSWFAPDGIHYSSQGYAERARLIAKALATAFPAGGTSHGCFIRLYLSRTTRQLQSVSDI
ncbi:MAG: SGNH/GDSL hydrolase family protein [Actinobacteria bacterium]|nr:SGNH/GDSL hydrolase family protein [Actinomycetota bacterium]